MELNLKIQDGIPIPTTTARKGNNIELLRSMKPGQSVFFDQPIIKRATRFYRVAKNIGAKVVIRKEAEGMRMWLIESPPNTPSSPSAPQAPKVKPVAKPKPAAKAAKKAVKPAAKPARKAKPPKTTKAPKKAARSSRKVEPARMADLPLPEASVEPVLSAH